MINNQHPICGIAIIHADNFLPNRSAINPNIMVPTSAPRHNNDPIHDASSGVIGPDGSGESLDSKIGRNGDVQPTAQP